MSTGNTSSDKATTRAPSAFLVTLGRLAGAVGAVLLITAPLTRILTGQFGVGFWAKVAVAVLLLGVYLATDRGLFARVAGSRSAGLTAMLWVSVAVVLGIIAAANYLAVKNDRSFDVTREGIFTLAPQTTELLARLDKDVTLLAFYSSGEREYATVKDALGRYAAHTERLSVRMVDPLVEDQLAEKYAVSYQGPRIVVSAGERDARVKDVTEQELTNAIIKVAEQTARTVHFLSGHGGHDLADEQGEGGYGRLAAAVRAEGYEVAPLSLLQAGAAAPGAKVDLAAAAAGGSPAAPEDKVEVPAEVSLLVIAGLESRLFAPELQAVEAYLKRGGRVLVMLEPKADAGLAELLAHYKIQVHNDIVVDTNPMNRLAGLGPASPLVYPTEQEHPATSGLGSPVVMFTARSLEVAAAGEPSIQAQALVGTGESAWGETNVAEGGIAERDDKDHPAPLDVGAVATQSIPSHEAERLSDEARLVVFGDSDWVDNRSLEQAGNTDLFLNTVNWMAEQEGKITIRPRSRQASQLFLTGGQSGTLKLFALDIIPVLLVALGVGIVRIRRQK